MPDELEFYPAYIYITLCFTTTHVMSSSSTIDHGSMLYYVMSQYSTLNVKHKTHYTKYSPTNY